MGETETGAEREKLKADRRLDPESPLELRHEPDLKENWSDETEVDGA